MKKIVSILVTIAIVFSMVISNVSAESSGNYVYSVSDGKATITSYKGTDTTLVIPSTLGGYPVAGIGPFAFYNKAKLLNVTIPNSVILISNNAFNGCTNMTAISIPNSVTSIGFEAFIWCYQLKNILIPGSVLSIGNSAFENCSGMDNVTLGNCLTSIGDRAFYNCRSLSSFFIPAGVNAIGSMVFGECPNIASFVVDDNNESFSSLGGVLFDKAKTTLESYPNDKTDTNYSIPKSVTEIKEYAFKGNYRLTEMSITDGVAKIGQGAFSYCVHIVKMIIPKSVNEIGKFAFNGCYLSEINVDMDNDNFTSIDGVLFNKAETEIITFPADKRDAYVVPDGTISIDENAFNNCYGLTSLTIPASVTEIGDFNFVSCGKLTEINVSIDNTQYSSENGVLFNKDKTVLIIYPAGKSGSYIVPEGVTEIGSKAFYSCRELSEITAPASVKSIGDQAFCNCKNLLFIYFFGDAPLIGDNVFMFHQTDFKVYYLNGKKGFTNPWKSYKTAKILTIKTATDNSSSISGMCVSQASIKLTLGSATYNIIADDEGTWSKKLLKKLSVGTTITVKVIINNYTSYSEIIYVKPSAPAVNKITSTMKSISGNTYAKAQVSIKINGTWKYITATSKGTFTLKLSKTLKKGTSVYFKVTYKGQLSAVRTVKVK